jgi:hypothetical protein
MHEWLEAVDEVVLSENLHGLVPTVAKQMEKSCILAEMGIAHVSF